MRHLVLLSALPIVVYVTDHGFGHAVRVGRVLGALVRLEPRVRLHVRAVAPPRFFPSGDRVTVEARRVDCGLVQTDALTPDLDATLEALAAAEASRAARIREEADRLRHERAVAVLADIPSLPFAAARAAEIPAFGLGNFSWDWIFAGLAGERPAFAAHAKRAAGEYATAARLFRLPFHSAMNAFPVVEDVPLTVDRSPLSREDARERLGLPSGRPIALLSFGGIDFGDVELGGLARVGDVLFVVPGPGSNGAENVRALDYAALDHTTLLRAADVVVTKPGWGTVAASLVNGVRVLYVWRGSFPEGRILVDALETHGTVRRLEADRLRRGDLAEDLEALLARPVRDAPLPADGENVVARRLLEEIGA